MRNSRAGRTGDINLGIARGMPDLLANRMTAPDCLASLDVSQPEAFGRMTGTVLVVCLFGLGMIKCVSIMRRPTTSKPCVLALLLLLAGWMASSLLSTVRMFSNELEGPVLIVGSLGVIVILLVALILAILGLTTYDKTRFRQGRAQAVWTIVLASLILIGVGVSTGRRLVQSYGVPLPAAERVAEGKAMEIREFNFSVTPSREWTQLQPKAVNALSCVALRQRSPETYGMVIGERFAGVLDVDQVREVSKSNLAGAVKVLKQTEDKITLNGIPFARFNTQAKLKGVPTPVEYEHWIAVNRGFSWQIVFWSMGGRAHLSLEARALMETFRILDPDLEGAAEGNLKDVDRPALGYRTGLEGMGWMTWESASGNALMDFRAERSIEALQVAPVRFDREAPDLEALTRGLLSTMGFDKVSTEEFTTRPWNPPGGGTGRELEIDHEVDGTRFHYLIRIARGERQAHLLAGWSALPQGNAELVRRSLDAITLRQATGEAPSLDTARKKALGLMMNEIGLSYTNRNDPEAAATWFLEGFKQGKNPTVLGNAADAFERAKQADKGRGLIAPHLEAFPTNHYLGLRYARLQMLGGDPEGGTATFLRMLENGLKNEEDLLAWLQLLNTNDQSPAALRCLDAWLARQPSCNVRRWQAQILSTTGNPLKAVELLEQLRKEFPDDSRVSYDLGNACNDAGEHAKAAAIAESLLAEDKDSIPALKMLGWSQMGRKWYRDAKTTFERAARNQPNDGEIKEAIRSASASLGEGDNSGVKDPIPPVELPKEVAAALAEKPVPEGIGTGHSSAWLMRATGYRFEKGKPIRQTVHRRVKVLTPDAAREFSSVETKFDPLAERVFMNRLEVRDASGKVIASASPNDAYVRDADDGSASTGKILHAQVAGVKPGTTVEWEVTIEDLGNSECFGFERHLFASGIPVATEAVFVTGDLGSLHAVAQQGKGLKTLRNKQLAAWISGPQPETSFEPFSIPVERRCPMLWLGSASESWEKVGADYLKQIEDRFTVDSTFKNLASSLVAGKATEREKIAAIARHVQKEIAYKAIEFGIRARRPNTAAETLRLRYGDCKDTALLTHLLLRAAGINSHLALVNSTWSTQAELPTLDQFNHMVVAVPALGPNWLLDPTDKSLSLGAFPADYLWHSSALILDPAKPRLFTAMGHAAPETSNIHSRRTVTADGRDWKVEESLDLTGYTAAWMRNSFSGLSANDQRDKAQSILAAQGAAQVQKFQFENLDEADKPARLTMTYQIPAGISESGGSLTGSLPALWERDYLDTRFVKDRKTPFEVLYPLHLSSEVILKLPSQPAAASVTVLRQQNQSPYCAWRLESEPSKEGLTIRFDFNSKTGAHPASGYAAFHESLDAARRAWEKPLIWKTP